MWCDTTDQPLAVVLGVEVLLLRGDDLTHMPGKRSASPQMRAMAFCFQRSMSTLAGVGVDLGLILIRDDRVGAEDVSPEVTGLGERSGPRCWR